MADEDADVEVAIDMLEHRLRLALSALVDVKRALTARGTRIADLRVEGVSFRQARMKLPAPA
jgi:hypothetical protein